MTVPSDPGKLPITVVVPVKNEAANLGDCLGRLGDFAAVWVVDSGSTDATCKIAAEHGARVLDFKWPGGFPKKRNWVLMNETFDTPWVLFLDADERVTPAFVAEVRAKLAAGGEEVAYWLNYTNHFLGGMLRHGVPQRKLALFKVGAGLYERIEDTGWSNLDMEVHEHPVIEGPKGTIAAKIDHLDFRGIEHFIARHNAYSSWEAARSRALLAGDRAGWDDLTSRQKKKYANLDKWWFAPLYFVVDYVLKRGFLDGRRGLDYALMKLNYFHSIKLKIDELKRK
jgi:glycosyltransferase involved in cell wall biosynthesis